MCSRNDQDDGLMEEKPKPLWTEVCQKCSAAKPVIQILQIKHAYCRDCFLAHVNHKFRSTLGKSKMMRPSDVVMAAFSGSVKSHVLLHLLHAGFSEKSHKRFLFKTQVLYIDEGAVLGLPLSDRSANLRLVAEMSEQYGFSAYFTSLSCQHDNQGLVCVPLNKDSALSVNVEFEAELNNLIANISSLTAKEDMLKQLRQQVLLRAAKELKCNKIFTAESSTDLAIHILTDVSLGRGAQMHHDVSFCDDRDEEVKILRPLLELSSKEIAFYSVYFKLSSVFIPSLCSKAQCDSSIHNLSKKFVMELMENFPSTVSTVFRTGEKLGSSSSTSVRGDQEDVCILCQVRLVGTAAPCSSSQATEFSRLISSLGPSGFDNNSLTCLPPTDDTFLGQSSCCGPSQNSETCCVKADVSGKCGSGQDMLTLSDVEKLCCYGCRLIVHDVKTVSGLPANIIETARIRKGLQSMRDSIKDFLL
ncbi:hypothetical protein ONE63_010938 [Megalurothrips usitatus]|uniref:Cytoplasmic tRNA 2-thiolation protein 2 n=1 Tax=Megalurothrips usitatus TaxID=439358 RepID=A0AAV7XIV7_9NEOP|nr:hypothetical protein ONE63_010938 [Megalurothrips usitatus]